MQTPTLMPSRAIVATEAPAGAKGRGSRGQDVEAAETFGGVLAAQTPASEMQLGKAPVDAPARQDPGAAASSSAESTVKAVSETQGTERAFENAAPAPAAAGETLVDGTSETTIESAVSDGLRGLLGSVPAPDGPGADIGVSGLGGPSAIAITPAAPATQAAGTDSVTMQDSKTGADPQATQPETAGAASATQASAARGDTPQAVPVSASAAAPVCGSAVSVAETIQPVTPASMPDSTPAVDGTAVTTPSSLPDTPATAAAGTSETADPAGPTLALGADATAADGDETGSEDRNPSQTAAGAPENPQDMNDHRPADAIAAQERAGAAPKLVDVSGETAASESLPEHELRPFESAARIFGSVARASGGSAATTVEAAHIRGQVLDQVVRSLVGEGGQEQLNIRLNPAGLGEVDVHFLAQDDRLTVVMQAGGVEAEHALKENLRELGDKILDRTGRFQHVDVRVEVRESGDQKPDNRQEQRQEPRQDGRQDSRRENGRQQRPGENEGRRAAWARAWAGSQQED